MRSIMKGGWQINTSVNNAVICSERACHLLEFGPEYMHFQTRKLIPKCHLPNGGHFISPQCVKMLGVLPPVVLEAASLENEQYINTDTHRFLDVKAIITSAERIRVCQRYYGITVELARHKEYLARLFHVWLDCFTVSDLGAATCLLATSP